MKRICLLALLVTQAVVAVPLSKKLYFRADGGVGFPVEASGFRFHNNFMYGAGVGFKFNDILRADLNAQARTINGKKGNYLFKSAQSDAAFLNLYLNLTDYEEMTPYLNAGVGYVRNKAKSVRTMFQNGDVIYATGGQSSGLGWNAGAGATVRVHNNLSIDAGYKYIHLGKITIKDSGEIPFSGASGFGPKTLKNIRTHEIFCGLIMNF